MIVFQLIVTAACFATVGLNMREYREWKRRTARARDAARLSGIVTAQLLIRSRAWLECDRCGGRLDTGIGPDAPVCLEVDDHDQLTLLCPTCAPLRASAP